MVIFAQGAFVAESKGEKDWVAGSGNCDAWAYLFDIAGAYR
jgi:hypothetical protein